MAAVKRIDRSATIAFSPVGPFLAAGSVAGAIDLSFSTSSVLEIFDLDLASSNGELRLAGAPVQAPERFSRLTWAPGPDPAKFKRGLLAGGLSDGSVCLWDPHQIVRRPAGSRDQLLARLQKHAGPVRGLEFSPLSQNLLASGASEGEVCVWDVADPRSPSLFPPMAKSDTASAQASEITHLAWNCKVAHILATATAGAGVVVWDLKKQRPIITLRDPSSVGAQATRASALAWNPGVATQLVVASDSDARPALQLWDLRNASAPFMELPGHARGVLGLAWSAQDPDLVLSSGKDARTLVWDVARGCLHAELPAASGQAWNFEVCWARGARGAGLFAAATFEGRVEVHSLARCAPVPTPDGSARHAPRWLRPGAGARFGFGGRLVSFGSRQESKGAEDAPAPAAVRVLQLNSAPELAGAAAQFKDALRGGDREVLAALCSRRAADPGAEAEVWAFLGAHFESDGRRHLLELLGFADVLPQEGGDAGEEEEEEEGGRNMPRSPSKANRDATSDLPAPVSTQVAADAFFDSLHSPQGLGAPAGGAGSSRSEELGRSLAEARPSQGAAPAAPADPLGALLAGAEESGDADEQALVRALTVGNFAAALDSALAAGRPADAMLIASLMEGSAWARARDAYMTAAPRPFMRVLQAVLRRSYASLVDGRPVARWRETLALLLSCAPADEYEALAARLAGRLRAAGDALGAQLCVVASGDVEAAAAAWGAGCAEEKGAGAAAALEGAVEKALVLGLGTGRAGQSEALARLLGRYADALVGDGHVETALAYLELIPQDSASEGVQALKDRILRSGAAAADQQARERREAAEREELARDLGAMAVQGGYATAPGAARQAAYAPQQAAYGGYGGASLAGGVASPRHGGGQQAPTQAYAPRAQGYGGAGAAGGQAFAPSQAGGQAFAPPQAGGQAFSPSQAGGQAFAPPHAAPQAYAPPQAAPQAYAPPHAAPQGYAPPQAAPQAYAPPQAAPQAFAPPQAAPQTYAPPQAAPQTYAPPQAAPQAYAPPQAAPQTFAVPQAAPQTYAPPQTSPHAYTPSQAPPQTYAPPQPPSQTYAPPQATPQTYAPPQAYGAPNGAASALQPRPPAAQATTPPTPVRGPEIPADVSVQNADVSSVSAALAPVVASLRALHDVCSNAVAAHPQKAREMEDAGRRIGVLFWQLNQGSLSQGAGGKLVQLCTAMEAADYARANAALASLTSADWDEAAAWLPSLKRVVKLRQMLV